MLARTHETKSLPNPGSTKARDDGASQATKPIKQEFQKIIEKTEVIDVEDGLHFKIRMPASEQSLYINELYLQLEELRKEISHRNSDLASLSEELSNEKDEKVWILHSLKFIL